MTKADAVLVKATRTFSGDEGMKHPESEPFEVSRPRAAELYANGLIHYVREEDQAEAKADRQPSNKKAADPSNKAG